MGRQTRKQKKKFRNIDNYKWMFRKLAVEEKRNGQNKIILSFKEAEQNIVMMD